MKLSAKIRFAVLGVVAAIPAIAQAQATNISGALWKVEQVCLAADAATGLPFPCLKVDAAAGYAVLRPPYGKADTILVPTVKISGLEAPGLQSPSAPNYFELAWQARSFLADKTSRKLAHDDVALAVNSSLSRSQNQLHVHLDCIARDMQMALRTLEPDLPATGWTRLAKPLRHLDYWALRLPQPTLAGINPFALVARGVPDARAGMAEMTIAIAGTLSKSGAKGFVLLAARTGRHVGRALPTGEDLLDHECGL